ncbi:DUF2809 domain-containing protein [Pontixanthobacter gangjinensis]|uniref:DUF2809 domain-containing protein n=1 Tax=Christiangramia aestuarii TaxID=1028746 RepID=A0A7M3SXZ4_9FLAO|nr:DUF2809 domain-containing protein [Christiangramia aestuarii]MUP41475.1 DUF2809 domain-containing protein [Christiangramia aestuarii]
MLIKSPGKTFYAFWFLIILIIETLIAIFLEDELIRPYGGDLLVVILIYCFIRAITSFSILKSLIIVFLFSFAVEFFQLINIVKVLQYQLPEIVLIVIGSSFSPWDLLAYSLGILLTGALEYYRLGYSENSTSTITGK